MAIAIAPFVKMYTQTNHTRIPVWTISYMSVLKSIVYWEFWHRPPSDAMKNTTLAQHTYEDHRVGCDEARILEI
jgi:hypothetical protein